MFAVPIAHIKECVTNALTQLVTNDFYLLESDAQEESISHMLAHYLKPAFSDWHVDCEYTRNVDDETNRKRVLLSEAKGLEDIRPDIIVHRRGTNTHNLLAIEVKKAHHPTNEITRAKNKLRAYHDQKLHYAYCLLVILYVGAAKVDPPYSLVHVHETFCLRCSTWSQPK